MAPVPVISPNGRTERRGKRETESSSPADSCTGCCRKSKYKVTVAVNLPEGRTGGSDVPAPPSHGKVRQARSNDRLGDWECEDGRIVSFVFPVFTFRPFSARRVVQASEASCESTTLYSRDMERFQLSWVVGNGNICMFRGREEVRRSGALP